MPLFSTRHFHIYYAFIFSFFIFDVSSRYAFLRHYAITPMPPDYCYAADIFSRIIDAITPPVSHFDTIDCRLAAADIFLSERCRYARLPELG
jgi:hypothetical protein